MSDTTTENAVRDRILKQYMDQNGGAKKKEKLKVVKVGDFVDTPTTDTEQSGQEDGAGRVMYSNTFPLAQEYLDSTGKPDLDITDLMCDVKQWEVEDQLAVPVLDEHYKWQHTVLYPALLGIMSKMKVLFVGPTGSGKTTFHQNLAAVFQQPFYRLGGRGDMESDVILGRQDMQNGSMDFLLGEFTKAYVNNYYILLDEIWKLPSNINMAFQRVFERGGLLQIDEARGELKDKQFYPGKHTHIMLADNVVGTGDGSDHYPATMIQDGSTINRMDMILKINYLSQDDEISMLLSRFSTFMPEHIAKKAVQVANLIRDGFEQRQVSVTMSPRNLISWMEMADKVRDYKITFEWVMLQRYADDAERGAVEGFYNTVFGR